MEEIRKTITDEGLTSKKGFKLSKSQIEHILNNTFYYGYMKSNEILYKHVYPRIITKELFDECQRVRDGKKRTKYRRTDKPFILKGRLKCHHCQCSYSPEVKYKNTKQGRKEYNYMRPTKCYGECPYCYHLNEEKILVQIENVLKGMHIPENILIEINNELKKSVEKEHQGQIKEMEKLNEELQIIQTRLKKARNKYLDDEMTQEKYDEAVADLTVEKENNLARQTQLSQQDAKFAKNISIIFQVASKAYEAFESSKIERKRQIINSVFSNLKLNGDKLDFTLHKPFDLLIKLSDCSTWLPVVSALRIFNGEIESTASRPIMFRMAA